MELIKYAPESVQIIGEGVCKVEGWIVHPPGEHKSSPIRNDMAALELQTSFGSRWYGVTNGWINSELRMVVSIPADSKCEIRTA